LICGGGRPILSSKRIEKMDAEQDIPSVSEAGFDGLYDLILDGIALLAAETKTLGKCNAALCAMLGYSKSELFGASIFTIHPAGSRAEVERTFEGLVEGKIDIARNIPLVT
jgi:PAS domain S-box-containing protein